MIIFLIIIATAAAEINEGDPASNQLVHFKEKHKVPVGILTTSAGEQVSYKDATVTLNTKLINNDYFMESLTHFNRERIPVRVVHAKGAGAFGYFKVTHDFSHICRADLFNGIGKITPVAVRFSSVTKEKGASDIPNDGRGFAVKFFSSQGNFDIVGLNMPVFLHKDPLKFIAAIHTAKKNPATDLDDSIAVWDFMIHTPEAFHANFYILGDRGVPASFSHMPGYSIHTYQVENNSGRLSFVRFHIIPDAGIKTLTKEEKKKAAQDADFYTRALRNDIDKGNFPSWTIKVQVVPLEDAMNDPNNTFDQTRTLNYEKYPLQELGRLVLNRNPKNNFAEVEQLAFCVCNLVDGIDGEPTALFEARRFLYRDAAYYRLGPNLNKIPVNCPYRTETFVYNRDGSPPVRDNEKDTPNYYKNSFNGPVPSKRMHRQPLIHIAENSEPNNFDQAGQLYRNGMTSDEQETLVGNIVSTLSKVPQCIQKRALEIFEMIDHGLANKVAQGIGANQNQTFSECN